MSRIHEALKKAELERSHAERPEAPARSADELLESVSARRAPVATLEPEAPAQEKPRADEGKLTVEMLKQRCSKPRWNPDPKTVLFLPGQDHGAGTEEFRTLRTRLYKIREKQTLRSVLVTSALPAEGKSFVSTNLAQVISRQHERRALLIDADLRKSRLHVGLGAPHAPGLTEYLRGEREDLDVIQQSSHGNLYFIPGGEPATDPAELLGNGRFQRLLQRAANIFDWIIVDSPPSIPVADASLLARMCDGVLFVVLSGSTPFDLAQKACGEFRDKHLVGAVLNRIQHGSSSYYYSGYGYGYGSGSTEAKE